MQNPQRKSKKNQNSYVTYVKVYLTEENDRAIKEKIKDLLDPSEAKAPSKEYVIKNYGQEIFIPKS